VYICVNKGKKIYTTYKELVKEAEGIDCVFFIQHPERGEGNIYLPDIWIRPEELHTHEFNHDQKLTPKQIEIENKIKEFVKRMKSNG